MKGALVTFIVKVEGVVKEIFSGAPPQAPTFFAPPPIKIPGGATVKGIRHETLGSMKVLKFDLSYMIPNRST